jgi:hypothetical protein
MDIPTDLSGVLSALGLPAGALALGYGLVRGAGALEEDANEDRLKEIAKLLKESSFTGVGKLGATVVPLVFTKVFGTNPLSLKFISRSVLASILFWMILLVTRHVNPLDISGKEYTADWTLLLAILFVDWISLVKSKLILHVMSKWLVSGWVMIFVIVDILLTILILLLCLATYLFRQY